MSYYLGDYNLSAGEILLMEDSSKQQVMWRKKSCDRQSMRLIFALTRRGGVSNRAHNWCLCVSWRLGLTLHNAKPRSLFPGLAREDTHGIG